MKKNISHKERILKETGLSEEEFYLKFPDQASYQEYCNGGKMKMGKGGKIAKAIPTAKAATNLNDLNQFYGEGEDYSMDESIRRNPMLLQQALANPSTRGMNIIGGGLPQMLNYINPHSLDEDNAWNREPVYKPQRYKLGGKLKKYNVGGNMTDIPRENTLNSLVSGLGNVTDFLGEDSKFGKVTKFLGEKALPFTGVAGAVGALGVGAMIGLDQRSQRLADDRLEASNNLVQQKKTLLNNFVNPDLGTSLPGFSTGGQIDKHSNSDLLTIKGSKHENGGTPINSIGQPVDRINAKAEAELGESMVGDYIFSDTLGLNKLGEPTANAKEVKTTYSKLAKKINSKYGKKTDTLGERTKEFEYNNLKAKNDESIKMKEEVDIKKAQNALGKYMKKYGGLIKYPNGGYDPNYRPNIQPLDIYGNIPGQERLKWPIVGTSGYQTGHGINMQSLFPGSPFHSTRDLAHHPTFIGDTYNPTTGVPQLLPNNFTPNWTVPQGNGFDPYHPIKPGFNPDAPLGLNPSAPPLQTGQDREIAAREKQDIINGNKVLQEKRNNPFTTITPDPNEVITFPDGTNSNSTAKRDFSTDEVKGLFGNFDNGYVNNYPSEVPTTGNNTDYAGLGLSTIAPLINFAYGTVKDNNKYYPNTKEGLARNELSKLPTEYNIDANLAQNSRDTIAQQKATNNRTPSVSNAINSQLLTNKLYANNQLYGTKTNAETQMKSDKLKTLSNFDYTSGENNRGQKIALEDKNLANKARREDLQLNAINKLAENLNTKRNEKVLMDNLPLVMKYTKVDSRGKLSIDSEKIKTATQAEYVIVQKILAEQEKKK